MTPWNPFTHPAVRDTRCTRCDSPPMMRCTEVGWRKKDSPLHWESKMPHLARLRKWLKVPRKMSARQVRRRERAVLTATILRGSKLDNDD